MHKQDHVASVNRQHELYTGFEAAGQASAQVQTLHTNLCEAQGASHAAQGMPGCHHYGPVQWTVSAVSVVASAPAAHFRLM